MVSISAIDPKQRRLVLTLYRRMVQCCNDINPKIPLKNHISILGRREIDNSNVLRQVIRDSFRETVTDEGERKARISQAFTSVKQLNDLKVKVQFASYDDEEALPLLEDKTESDKKEDNELKQQQQEEDSWTNDVMNQVEWLSSIPESLLSGEEESKSVLETQDPPAASRCFPMFPMSSIMYDPSQKALPVFTNMQEVPMPGMDVPLQIFEPRYRKMYDDLMTQQQGSSSKMFVVPFSHPTIPTKYARYGLLYKITDIKEVADETNGMIQYRCNHRVTRAIRIQRIINPHVWETQETYLQVEGSVKNNKESNDDASWTKEELAPLQEALVEWTKSSSDSLPRMALKQLLVEGIWGFCVHWISYLEHELLHLQISIAAKAQARIQSDTETTENPDEILEEMQREHRQRLVALKLNIALLVPRLLQMSSNQEKCQFLVDMIKAEKVFQEE
jgi:Lon protease-like protein